MSTNTLSRISIIFGAGLICIACGCLPASAQPTQINGQPIVVLKRAATSHGTKPEFLTATILPGRGMNLLQITANIPGKGDIDVLATPSLDEVARQLSNDEFGNKSFSTFGGAFLVPYANRIRGTLSADGKSITTSWQGHPLNLPANWSGKKPGAERHAIHGLILTRKADDLKVSPDGASVTATIHAGNFNGHWLSSTDLTIRIDLRADSVESTIVAKNVGSQDEPMGIGWHPYFTIPSGQRDQVRLHIPATKHVETNNLDDVFPTGKLTDVKGTANDFTAPAGKIIGNSLYDDSFAGLVRTHGEVIVDLTDPASHYGLHIEGLSPEIRTVQFYAPKDKPFVALEQQFNFGDPFSSVWKGMDTGMVDLKPGQSTTWKVRLQLFTPGS
ncbi:MAG TPA: aldose 1-epimerase [Terracidiphilus sp.]|jgi:galactose mutarotase-like enzyme